MTAPDEFGSELHVVENLAIKDDPQRAVLVVDWLTAAGYVNDTQARMRKPNLGIDVKPRIIRAAMPNRGDHPPKRGSAAWIRSATHKSCYAAHDGRPFLRDLI